MICENCNGRKLVQGFGGLRKECKICNGSGKIDKPIMHVDKRSREYREMKKQKGS
jgi:hypothetical protein